MSQILSEEVEAEAACDLQAEEDKRERPLNRAQGQWQPGRKLAAWSTSMQHIGAPGVHTARCNLHTCIASRRRVADALRRHLGRAGQAVSYALSA